MTTIVDNELNNMPKDGLEVWHCEACRCFHMRAAEVLIMLTPKEFATFTQDVVDFYCTQMTTHGDE